jgi:hypothetical protein
MFVDCLVGCIAVFGLAAVIAAVTSPALALENPGKAPLGADALTGLARLPLLRAGTWAAITDSHDVRGYNDDGFTGSYSYVYKDGDEYVLFEEEGPGCVCEIRTIGFKGHLRIYLDGAREPQRVIAFSDLYAGTHAPFLKPFVAPEAEAHGSSWCYVPIPFAKGCKLTTDEMGGAHFFNIVAHRFAAGTPVQTFDPNSVRLDDTVAVWSDPAAFHGSGAKSNVLTGTLSIPPLERGTLLDIAGSGAILRMRFALPGSAIDRASDLILKGYWDGVVAPQVDSPASTFFALGCPRAIEAAKHADPALLETDRYKGGALEPRSLAVGVDNNGKLYCQFPMPFWKLARIDLLNRSTRDPITVEYEITTTEEPYPDEAGYFHALWREETPLRPAEDYVVLDTRGRGHYVGCVMTFSSVYQDSPYNDNYTRVYLEGDARFYPDEIRTPLVAGTGTEEYFNWGWYDMRPHDEIFTYPTHGYPLNVVRNQSQSVMYRFHLSDPIPYYRSFRFDFEHGPEGRVPAHYSSTAFYYQRDDPGLDLTDEIDLGDPASEKAHAYSRTGGVRRVRYTVPYEGSWQLPYTADAPRDRMHAVKDDGYSWTGSARFTVAIAEDNQGVKLRRRCYCGTGPVEKLMCHPRPEPIFTLPQKVAVEVDGIVAGYWNVLPRHARATWLDTDFEIPEVHTRGKRSITITLKAVDKTRWEECTYWVFSYRAGRAAAVRLA